MNKALVAIIVIAIGIVAGWYFVKGRNAMKGALVPKPSVMETPAPTGPMQEETAGMVAQGNVTVMLTASGFSPKTVTVKKGTVVTFTNAVSGNMWIASDVYPTDQLLPGFNALKNVGNGGTYTYTFTKVGTWAYHNEAETSVKGTVVVTE